MRINSVTNLNFKAKQAQEKEPKFNHKTKLFLGSLIALEGARLTRDQFIPNKEIKEPELKTLKGMLTKENLKATGKTVGKYLGLGLIIASVINFFLDEEKANKLMEDFLIMSA